MRRAGPRRRRGPWLAAWPRRGGGGGWRLALEAGAPVGVEHLTEPGDEVRPDQGPQVVVATNQRDLARHGLDPAVDRGDHQNVGSGVAAPPDPDSRGVDLGQGAGVRDGVAVVADLGPRVDLLPRLAIAGTEVAVVEHQHVEPRPVEYLSKTVEVHLLDRREAVGHDHNRRRAGLSRIEPAAQDDTLGIELDVASCHLDLLRTGHLPSTGSVQPSKPP